MQSTFSPLYRAAIELNNIGASLLETHRYDAADQTFREALQTMQDAVRADGDDDAALWDNNAAETNDKIERAAMRIQDPPEEAASITTLATFPLQGIMSSTIEGSIIMLRSNVASNRVMIYNEPITVRSLGGQQFRAHQLTDAALSMFIVYNMSLTKHIRGIARGEHDDLERALRMYELAQDLCCPSGFDTQDPEDFSDAEDVNYIRLRTLLFLGMLNNMGHICCLLGRHATSMEYYEDVSIVTDWYHVTFLCPSGAAAA